MLAKKNNLSNQLDSLKDTNSRLIDYVKTINTKVGTANSGKEFSEITENNKSRKIKEFKSKAETALWFEESQYLKLESTDGQTADSRISNFVVVSFSVITDDLTLSSKDQNVFCIVNCKEDYDHLKLACKHMFQKINTLNEKNKY